MPLASALALALGISTLPAAAGDSAAGRVIAVYGDRNSTKLVIEAREPLVTGTNVYAGTDEVAATLGDLLSKSGELLYYSASVPGKADLEVGDEVVTARRRIAAPNPLRLKITEAYTFEQKRKGEVTAVQDGRAMIDRGTLHEVRERDLYRVYGPDNRYKGLLEVRGIGDLQSSGLLYNALEDTRREALAARPGDRVVFVGQRKLFGLGLAGGQAVGRADAFGEYEKTAGGGLVWSIIFRDGWGFEVLFGEYSRKLSRERSVRIAPNSPNGINERMQRSARFIAPVWLKKSFFYPRVASPFAAAGVALFDGRIWYNREVFDYPNPYRTFSDEVQPKQIVPVLGAGVELFPARFFRPRFEVRWFDGPTLVAGPETFATESTFISFGFLTAW